MDESSPLPEVMAAWSEVLGGQDIRPDDDFFALGGDSLGVVRVLGLLEEALGVTVPAIAMLETRTARELADRLRP